MEWTKLTCNSLGHFDFVLSSELGF